MKLRITALVLATALVLGLAACGAPAPQESAPAPTEEAATPTPATPTPEVTAQPAESAAPSQAPSTEPTAEPTAPAIGDPTAPPAEEPSAEPEPTDTPSIAVPAASTVYDAVVKAAGETAATMDASAVLENFYNLSASDLEDFAFYMPELSTYTEELFIARAKEGKLDSVKAACQSRLDGMKEDGAFYPATALYLDGAQIVTQGDWIMLCVCPDAAGAVKAFQDAVK